MLVKIYRKNIEFVRFILIVGLLLLSNGCSASFYDEQMSGLKSNRHNVANEPSFPDLKINNSTILGIDSNNDGIRDDVEIWINDKFTKENERKEVRKYFKAIFTQLKMVHEGYEYEYGRESEQKEKLKKTVQDMREVMGCLIYLKVNFSLNNLAVIKGYNLVYNTKERINLNKLVDMNISSISYPIRVAKESCKEKENFND